MNRVENLPLKDAYRTEQDYTERLMGFEDSIEAQRLPGEARSAVALALIVAGRWGPGAVG